MKNRNLETQNNLIEMPQEIIRYIASFLNPFSLYVCKNLYLHIFIDETYWKNLTEKNFGWLFKIMEIQSEEKNYMTIFKILTLYERTLKNIKFPVHLFTVLDKFDKIRNRYDVNTNDIPLWLNGEYFLQAYSMHKRSAIQLFKLMEIQQHLQNTVEMRDSSKQRNCQKKILYLALAALETGYGQKNSYERDKIIATISTSNLIPSQKFEILEKYYQYQTIFLKASELKITDNLQDLYQKWYSEMLETIDPQVKLQRIDGLISLLNSEQSSFLLTPQELENTLSTLIQSRHEIENHLSQLQAQQPQEAKQASLQVYRKKTESSTSTNCLIM